jgi:hypothetical protein
VERAEQEKLRADDVKIDVRRGSTNEPIFLEFEATNLAATFKLGEKLGEGAFAVVVEGVHRRTGKVSLENSQNKKLHSHSFLSLTLQLQQQSSCSSTWYTYLRTLSLLALTKSHRETQRSLLLFSYNSKLLA